MKKIEKYVHVGKGYNPFLIRDGWQVAQLNYVAKHGLDDIDQIEVHNDTDEAFILMDGDAVLVEADVTSSLIYFECIKMEKFVTYNVPAGTWHNIAMSTDVRIIIVEKLNTHLNDVAYMDLSEVQKQMITESIQVVLNK